MTDAQETTPALGWMAAREAAAETVRAILVRDGDHTQARQPECADKMFKYAEELPAAIRALPAPTSAQLLAEAMRPRYRRADLPVRVKPLVWVQSHMTPWQDDWHTIPTGYTIRCADENGWKWQGWGVVGYCPHPTTAKAAAQADHDARIRAALEE